MGYYSTTEEGGNQDTVDSWSAATTTMSQQLPCPRGYYCSEGVRHPCPAGTFLGRTRAVNATQCMTCVPGGYCPSGSGAPRLCGGPNLYCPAGAPEPLVAGPGYYTVGLEGARSLLLLCPPGSYCPGDGYALECPEGSFGSTEGLSSASCDGTCVDGAQCGPRSTSPEGVPCPAGFTCMRGVATPCPAGRYNNATGASDPGLACLPCPAGTYSGVSGATSAALCTPCRPKEGSHPGAVACWPGVTGEWRGGREKDCVCI